MRDCEQCGKPVDGMQCPHCGFGKPIGASSRMFSDADWRKAHACVYEERGERCANLGTLTENTRGGTAGEAHPGAWYCHQHFPPFRGRYGPRSAPPPGWKNAIVKHAKPIGIVVEDMLEREAIQAEGIDASETQSQNPSDFGRTTTSTPE